MPSEFTLDDFEEAPASEFSLSDFEEEPKLRPEIGELRQAVTPPDLGAVPFAMGGVNAPPSFKASTQPTTEAAVDPVTEELKRLFEQNRRKRVAEGKEPPRTFGEWATTPAIRLPRFTINKDDPIWVSAVKEIDNLLISLPEFATAPAGMAAAPASMIPGGSVAVRAAFAGDIAKSMFEQAPALYENWSKLSPAEKTKGIVDFVGSGALFGTLAKYKPRAGMELPPEGVLPPAEIPFGLLQSGRTGRGFRTERGVVTSTTGEVVPWPDVPESVVGPVVRPPAGVTVPPPRPSVAPAVAAGAVAKASTPADIAKQLGLASGKEVPGDLWQFDVLDPKDKQPITFSVPKGSDAAAIDAAAKAKLAEFAETPPLGETKRLTTATPADLEPALLVNGKPVSGGFNHEAIFKANFKPESPDAADWFVAQADDASHVFVDKAGNYYTRREAADLLKEKEPLTSERLRDMQKATPEAKPPEPAPAVPKTEAVVVKPKVLPPTTNQIPPNSAFIKIVNYDGKTVGVVAFPHDGTLEGIAKASKQAHDYASANYVWKDEFYNTNSQNGATDANGTVRWVTWPENGKVAEVGTPDAAYMLGDLRAYDKDLAKRIIAARDAGDVVTVNKLVDEKVAATEAKAKDHEGYAANNQKAYDEALKKRDEGKSVKDEDDRYSSWKDYLSNLKRHIDAQLHYADQYRAEAEKWNSLKVKSAAPTPPTPPTPTAKEPWEMTAVEARREFPTLSQDKWDSAVTAAWKDGRLTEDSAPVQSMMRSKPRDFGEIDAVLNGRMEPSADLLKRHPDLAKPTPAPAAEKKGKTVAELQALINKQRGIVKRSDWTKKKGKEAKAKLEALENELRETQSRPSTGEPVYWSRESSETDIRNVTPKGGADTGERVRLANGQVWEYKGISGYKADNLNRVNGWENVTRRPEQPTPPPGTQGLAQKALNKWIEATNPKLGIVPQPPEFIKELIQRTSPYVKAVVDTIMAVGKHQFDIGKATDFRRSVFHWSAKLQRSFGEAASAQKEIRTKVPDKTRREGITNWIQAAGDPTILASRRADTEAWRDPVTGKPHPQQKQLLAGYDAALHLTPEEIAVAQDVKRTYDELGNRGQTYDVLKTFKDNYVTQIWNLRHGPIPKGAGVGRSLMLKDRFRFAKASKFDTFFDGEQAGYVPRTKDIADILPLYMHEMNSVIAARQLVEQMAGGVGSDGRKLLAPRGVGMAVEGDKGKATLVMPDVPAENTRDYVIIENQPALHEWRWVTKDAAGNPVFNKSDLMVHPEVADHFKNVLGRSAIKEWYRSRTTASAEIPKAIARGLDFAQSETKRTMLGVLTPFHQVQEGTHAVGHRVNPFFNNPKIDLVNDAGQMDAAKHGLMLLPDRTSSQQFMEGFKQSALVTKIPVLGPLADHYSEYLFHQYIPGIKYKTYQAILQRNTHLYGKELTAGRATLEDIKILSAEQANAAYGHLNYADLGRNPTILHIMRLGLLAPDFLEARARFAGQAIKGVGGAKIGREQLVALATLALAQASLSYIMANITGGTWDEKDPFAFHVGNKKFTMRSVPEDAYRFAKDTRSFVYARLNPIIGRGAVQYASGVDWRGQKVTKARTTKELLTQPVPLFLRPLVGLGNTPLMAWEEIAAASGLKISRYSAVSEMYKVAHQWKADHPDPKVQRAEARYEASSFPDSDYKPLRESLIKNDMKGALTAYEELLKTGHPHKDIDNVMKPWTGGTVNKATGELTPRHPKAFTSAKLESRFVDSLTDEQKATYNRAIIERRELYARFQQMLSQQQPKQKPTSEFSLKDFE